MSLSLAEFHIRKRLPRRSSILLFDAACLLGWTTVTAIAELAGVSRRRAELELVELVGKGWLRREWRGPRNHLGQVRFAARVATIAGDRTATIADDRTATIADDRSEGGPTTRRTQARDHARQKESLSLDPGSHGTTRPSVLGGPGGTDGRTEGEGGPRAELRNALLEWVATRHNVDARLSTPGLMRLLNAGATEHELRAFLTDGERGSHPCFDGLEHADFRFGAMCTVERFEKWRASRARARAPVDVEPPRPRHTVNAISAHEIEEFVRTKLRR